jgi:hypothetical protein
MRSNAYARAITVTRGFLTGRLQSGLSRITGRSTLWSYPCDCGTQIARELARIDSLILNVLSDSAEHRRRNSGDDPAGVVAAKPGNIAHSLCHCIVVIAEHLRKRSGSLWVFRLDGGFTMDHIRATRVRVRGHRGSHKRNRGVNRSLCNEWIDPQSLTHLLDGGVAYLLLNLLLN